MSVEDAKRFMDDLQNSNEFREEVTKVIKERGLEGCQRHCRDSGYDFSRDDLNAAIEEVGMVTGSPGIEALVDFICCVTVLPEPPEPPIA